MTDQDQPYRGMTLQPLRRALGDLQNYAGKLTDWLSSLGPPIARALPAVFDTMAALGVFGADMGLKRYGWWYAPGMPPELVIEVSSLAAERQGRTVTARITSYYRQNRCKPLRLMVENWNKSPYFARRRTIFAAALRAHRRREYALSVPSLLPHIEGITRELLQDHQLAPNQIEWDVIAATLGAWQPMTGVTQTVLIASFSAALQTTFFSQYAPNTSPSTDRMVNRHGVLHGRHVHYASEANSLRCFLALQSLFVFVEALSRSARTTKEIQRAFHSTTQAKRLQKQAAKQALASTR